MDFRIAGIDLADRLFTDDELAALTIKVSAYDGTIGTGSAIIPDRLGTDAFLSGRQFRLRDSGVWIADLFIRNRTQTRGQDPLVPAKERQYDLEDANALLYQFIAYMVRPAELDYDRVLAWAAEFRPDWDTTWVKEENGVLLPAKTYRDENGFDQLITDTKEATGKTLWVHDLAAGGRCLHYHGVAQDQGHEAELRLSDDRTEWDWDTYYPVASASKSNSGRELFNRIVGRDQASRRSEWIVESSRLLHDVDGMYHEKLVEFEADSQAELDNLTFQYAVEHHAEAVMFEVKAMELSSAAMGKWRAGDRMNVQAEAVDLPDVLSPYRISYATITVNKDRNGAPRRGFWDVTFEMGKPIRVFRQSRSTLPRILTPFVPGAGECTGTEALVPDAVRVFVEVSGTTTHPLGEITSEIDDAQGPGSRLIDGAKADGSGNPTDEAGYNVTARILNGTLYRTVDADFGSEVRIASMRFWETSLGPFLYVQIADSLAGPWTTVSHSVAGSGVEGSAEYVEWTLNSPPTTRYIRVVTETTGAGATGFSGALMSEWTFSGCVPTVVPPAYAQRTCEEVTGDGTTGPYTLNFPYLPGSIEAHGKVSGLAWTVDETDPTTGEFETAENLDGTLVVCYQATGDDGTGESNPQPTPVSPTGSVVEALDEGVSLTTTLGSIDFVGAGVTATTVGDDVTVTIPGGATDHGALTGLADDDHAQYLKAFGGEEHDVVAHGSMGATETFDPAGGNWHTGTLDANCTLTLTGPTSGKLCKIVLELLQDGTGGWTITLPASVTNKTTLEAQQVTTLSTVAYLVLWTRDGGTNWTGGWIGGGGSTIDPATTVEDETTFGISPAVGSDTEYARQDHTHGSPSLGTTSTTAAAGDHTHTGLGGAPPHILLASDHATPFTFDEILQASDGSDFLYASE